MNIQSSKSGKARFFLDWLRTQKHNILFCLIFLVKKKCLTHKSQSLIWVKTIVGDENVKSCLFWSPTTAMNYMGSDLSLVVVFLLGYGK